MSNHFLPGLNGQRAVKMALVGACLAVGATVGAAAEVCGAAPIDVPKLPDGATATPEQIRIARQAVITHSGKVDSYLNCMDARYAKVSAYLTKEQRERWNKDSSGVHEKRRQLQLSLNKEIRAFRRRQ